MCVFVYQELLRLYEYLACTELKLKNYRLVIKNAHLAQGISRTSAKAFYLEAKVVPTTFCVAFYHATPCYVVYAVVMCLSVSLSQVSVILERLNFTALPIS